MPGLLPPTVQMKRIMASVCHVRHSDSDDGRVCKSLKYTSRNLAAPIPFGMAPLNSSATSSVFRDDPIPVSGELAAKRPRDSALLLLNVQRLEDCLVQVDLDDGAKVLMCANL